MNVLRMIKLFGWESRVRDDIAKKREEELRFIWKRKVLGLLNNISKYVSPPHRSTIFDIGFAAILSPFFIWLSHMQPL